MNIGRGLTFHKGKYQVYYANTYIGRYATVEEANLARAAAAAEMAKAPLPHPRRLFTEEMDRRIRLEYSEVRNLKVFAKSMGVSVASLYNRAHVLGTKRAIRSYREIEDMSDDEALDATDPKPMVHKVTTAPSRDESLVPAARDAMGGIFTAFFNQPTRKQET